MNKKTIIIIGATSGIGRALFEKYAVDGNSLGIVICWMNYTCNTPTTLSLLRLTSPNEKKSSRPSTCFAQN